MGSSDKKRKSTDDTELSEKKKLKLAKKEAKKQAKLENKKDKSSDKLEKQEKKKEKKEKKEKNDKSSKKEKKEKKDKSSKVEPKEEEEVNEVEEKEESTNSNNTSTNSNYIQSSELTNLSQSKIDEFLSTNEVTIEDPQNLNYRPIISFNQINLNNEILKKLNKFSKPTPIQSVSWPYLIDGKDVIGVAETGSGKTMAFGVPAINNIITSNNQKKDLSVLCISPTRELALQIYDNLKELTDGTSISCIAIYGGVSKDEQIQKIKKGVNVVIATPGRLVDLINDGLINLSKINYLVLDEADRMLEKGFEEDIKKIIGSTNSKNRQTLMFTATWPKEVRDLANNFMINPIKITIGDRDELSANKRITQIVEVLDDKFQKEKKLINLLHKYQGSKVENKILVFALYKKEASRIESLLKRNNFKVAAIHGDLSQQQRTQALDSFKSGSCNLLLATDVAARGLDIPNVKYVINLTFPLTIEDYVHRIGRTGRAGQSGIAHTFFTEDEKHLSGALCNILRGANQKVPEELLKFGGHTKKKTHSVYGAFYKDVDMSKTAKKIKFD
ncbi:DBP3 [Candida pseudojiufengensis]|uniref:DBP3 n=1 Tax=Candida pseudojiufengensis TaxID=497109 RepID=UPI0022249FA4|nr:DBP3 [Candida pseudojiufengensis]KAI5961389.1 DBP3 [Candida pseudojiufengensis]